MYGFLINWISVNPKWNNCLWMLQFLNLSSHTLKKYDQMCIRDRFKVTLETKDELWSLKESIFNLIDASKQE